MRDNANARTPFGFRPTELERAMAVHSGLHDALWTPILTKLEAGALSAGTGAPGGDSPSNFP